jgi:hypothetical protein
MTEVAERLLRSIEDHWSCAEGPPGAWFEFGFPTKKRHPYVLYGACIEGSGPDVEERLARSLLFTLKQENEGGLLIWRRKPEISTYEDDGGWFGSIKQQENELAKQDGKLPPHEPPKPVTKTKITARLCFIGGKTSLVSGGLSPVFEGCPLPELKD